MKEQEFIKRHSDSLKALRENDLDKFARLQGISMLKAKDFEKFNRFANIYRETYIKIKI